MWAEPWSNGQSGRLQSGRTGVQIPPRTKICILSLFLSQLRPCVDGIQQVNSNRVWMVSDRREEIVIPLDLMVNLKVLRQYTVQAE